MTAKGKNTGCGCGCALAVLVAFVGLPTAGYLIAERASPTHTRVVAHKTPPPSTPATPATPATPTTIAPPREIPTVRGALKPLSSTIYRAAAARPTYGKRPVVGPADDPFTVGFCAPSSERTRVKYDRTTGGAASTLKGKVVLVHLRIEAPGIVWTPQLQERMETSALAVGKLYQREADRYGVDLELTTIPWPMHTSVSIPSITPGARDLLSDEAARALEQSIRKGLLASEEETLDRAAKEYREQGYDQVAFIAYVPTSASTRSFALAHGARDPSAEMAIVFEASSVVAEASVAAHEGLHLFGADDLYRLTPEDAGDSNDLMSVCRGFSGNGIEDATAWAIGWLDAPPARRYRF